MKIASFTRYIERALLLLLVGGFVAYRLISADSNPKPTGEPTPAPSGEGWINLLDATHAPHWKNVGDDKEIFEIKDEVLHIFGHTIVPLRYATYTAENFGDFELHLEFKLAKRCNSGLFLRAQPNDPVYRGFEVQVLEDHGDPPSKNSCGSIYDVVSPMFNLSRPAGEWNSYDIRLQGKQVTITMNGWKIIDTDLSKMTKPIGKFPIAYTDLPLTGSIALQDHGGEAWYRNFMVRPL